jgi:hypothetical protein
MDILTNSPKNNKNFPSPVKKPQLQEKPAIQLSNKHDKAKQNHKSLSITYHPFS